MATANIVHIRAEVPAVFRVPDISSKSAETASRILQTNHDVNDIVQNAMGHHNHIVHHICATLALGASPEALQRQYDHNASSQRPPRKLDEAVIASFDNDETYINAFQRVNQPEQYNNFRVFFTRKIEQTSVEQVLDEYLFKGDAKANLLFNRLFTSYCHPLIHLGCGLEFQQPAIVAEGLGQTCIHPVWQDEFFESADQKAKQPGTKPERLTSLLDQTRADRKLSTASKHEQVQKLRDGPLAKARAELVEYCSHWQVSEHDLDGALAEIISACAYFTAGAQNPSKQIKFDFFLLHTVTSTIFLPAYLKQTWISPANKAKMLEWKGRLDLALYAALGSPEPLLADIIAYPPHGRLQSWDEIIDRAKNYDQDDGHAAKFVRALAHGERFCKPYKDAEHFRIRGKMWRQTAQAVMDSVEGQQTRWVRGCGFEQAWANFADRNATANGADVPGPANGETTKVNGHA